MFLQRRFNAVDHHYMKALICVIPLLLIGCSSSEQIVERKHYHLWEKDIGYSQVVQVNNTLYISGITSERTGFSQQLDDVYSSLKNILSDYNVTTDSIVKEVIYTTDMEKLQAAISVRKKHFNGLYPSSSWVEVNRLFSPDHMVEIELVVVLPSK